MIDPRKNDSEETLNKIANELELVELKRIKSNAETSPQNSELYEQRLLDAFPTERDSNCEYFYPNTFWGDVEADYLVFREIFENKNWNQVNLDVLYTKYVQFLMLNTEGRLYYLPTFLKYYYDLRRTSMFYDDIFFDLTDGHSVHTLMPNGRYETSRSFSAFGKLTFAQSKLVALFMTNHAILLPPKYTEKAKKALKNYWGKFLLS